MRSQENMFCFSFSAADVAFLEMGMKVGESSKDNGGLLEVARGNEQPPG